MSGYKQGGKKGRGLLLVFTGNGKGKTTAAVGLSVRAAGHRFRVCFIQFIKGGWKTGEMVGLSRCSDLIEFRAMGRGFTFKSDDIEKDKEMARNAWDAAKEAIRSGEYRMVVLDELTYPINYGMIDLDDLLETLRNRNSELHVVITGRNCPGEILEIADLVTEMKDIKHPYRHGIKAQKGIEF